MLREKRRRRHGFQLYLNTIVYLIADFNLIALHRIFIISTQPRFNHFYHPPLFEYRVIRAISRSERRHSRRHLKNDESPSKEPQDEVPTAAEKRNQENPLAEKAEDDYDRKKELCGSPLSELACHNGVHELESPGNDFRGKVDASYATPGVVQRTQAPVELYGTSAI
ncbi:hypothetical protein FQN55_006664 [Onygenales sp. PD_40]|nr:hypothetical protein FQN55_006664 [Onygenales sp. PD_40]